MLVPNDEEPELEAEAQAQEVEALRPVALGEGIVFRRGSTEEAAAAPVINLPSPDYRPSLSGSIPSPDGVFPLQKGRGFEPRTGKPWSRA